MLPNVTLQVIPFDARFYEPMSTTFTFIRFGHEMANDIVYLEMYSDAAHRPDGANPAERTARSVMVAPFVLFSLWGIAR
jgi:hypothetical protein